ncbi:MAG: FCD domain-containing protein [Lachnospiraceae bacterium]|nr:FCD domain-containing protein [Lachnospiraceae bacterium]
MHFCEELICKSQRFWYMALFNNRMDVVREEHLQILDALLSGDTAAAAAYCEKHISISKALSILSE